jgi:hypothetical protein
VPGVKNDGEDGPALGFGEVGVLVSPLALDRRDEELVPLPKHAVKVLKKQRDKQSGLAVPRVVASLRYIKGLHWQTAA